MEIKISRVIPRAIHDIKDAYPIVKFYTKKCLGKLSLEEKIVDYFSDKTKEIFTVFRLAIATLGAVGYMIANWQKSNWGKGVVVLSCLGASVPGGMILLSGILLTQGMRSLFTPDRYRVVKVIFCIAMSWLCLDQYDLDVLRKGECIKFDKAGLLEMSLDKYLEQ